MPIATRLCNEATSIYFCFPNEFKRNRDKPAETVTGLHQMIETTLESRAYTHTHKSKIKNKK